MASLLGEMKVELESGETFGGGTAPVAGIEAPFWGVEHKRLEAGEERQLKAGAIAEPAKLNFKIKGTEVEIRCTHVSFKEVNLVGSKTQSDGKFVTKTIEFTDRRSPARSHEPRKPGIADTRPEHHRIVGEHLPTGQARGQKVPKISHEGEEISLKLPKIPTETTNGTSFGGGSVGVGCSGCISWAHLVGGQSTLWPENETHEIKAENEGVFTLKGKISGSAVVFKCESAKAKGNIWDGSFQGEDLAKIEFGNCTISKAITCIGAKIEITPAEVYSELQWKYAGNTNELKEVGQQKIYDVLAPTAVPVEGKQTLDKVTIKKEACETINGEFPIEAVGTPATFVDQSGVGHKIIWGTAPLVEPQNTGETTNHLTWASPNITQLHHQGTQTKARLLFGGVQAELEGKLKVELNSAEAFGAFGG
jgi:hypothetical protein